MVTSLSVLVATRDPGPVLAELVASWDAQSLPLAAFDVVVADGGSTDGSTQRLRQVAERRPNVKLLEQPHNAVAELLAAAFEASTGAWIVVLDQQRRLTPRALELMHRFAEQTGADIVLGRSPSADASGSDRLPADLDRLDRAQALAALPSGCLAVRRELLMAQQDRGQALVEPRRLLESTEAVSGLGSVAVTVPVDHRGEAESSLGLALSEVKGRWHERVVEIEARASVTGASGADARGEDASMWLVLTQAGGLAEITVAATVEGSGAPEVTSLVRARLDPAMAYLGNALPDGIWNLALRVATSSGEATVALPAVRVASAILDGRLFSLPRPDSGLQLDVGASRSNVAGWVGIENACVVENATGSLLTLSYPGIHVRGDSERPAAVKLDRFQLPVLLICRSGVARVEGFVSGLAGTAAITVSTGGGSAWRTGLDLSISNTGVMSLAPTPPPPAAAPTVEPAVKPADPKSEARPAPAPAPSAQAPAAAEAKTTSMVQRLRRRAPTAIEPAIRRLASVAPLRAVYRRLIER